MHGQLAGKVIILTGGAGGQGRAAARLLVSEGARLVFTDRDPSGEALSSELGSDALFLRHDIANPEHWARVVNTTVGHFGGIDGLVNNAGIAGRDRVETLTPDGLHQYFDINVVGALNGIQAVLPAMRERGGGSIVNVASTAALRATPGLAGYAISKWALRGLTRNAASELAADRIRVNLVLPGAVDVQMIKDEQAPAGKASVAAQIPLGRVARAEEIVRASLFLLSDAATYITGEELVIDGGWSI
ncbi:MULTISPECIES: SDR family NAD(P)-dependent oxidoreductase [unclassified Novosphingobium]|nr:MULTISPECIES: glucose 1-dehydrogenase [unclassified Novosphingobium]